MSKRRKWTVSKAKVSAKAIAEEAVKYAAAYGVELDYSIESLKTLDAMLASLHVDYEFTRKANQNEKDSYDEEIFDIYAELLGCYMLEVMESNNVPGNLTIVDDQFGKSTGFTFASGAFSDFVSWCFKAIVYGDVDAIWPKYVFFTQLQADKKIDQSLKTATFYIYFSMDNKQQADQLEEILTKKQFKVDAHKMEDMWSLVISKELHGRNELKAVQKELEALAAEYSGEYDGHEIEV